MIPSLASALQALKDRRDEIRARAPRAEAAYFDLDLVDRVLEAALLAQQADSKGERDVDHPNVRSLPAGDSTDAASVPVVRHDVELALREGLRETLARWARQGYTDIRETPIDDYGRRILYEIDRELLKTKDSASLAQQTEITQDRIVHLDAGKEAVCQSEADDLEATNDPDLVTCLACLRIAARAFQESDLQQRCGDVSRCGHVVPEGWKHEVLESQSPLPKFWSCMVWRGSERFRGQSSESADAAVTAAVDAIRGATPPQESGQVESEWAIAAVKYARQQVIPIRAEDPDYAGTPYERGLMNRLSATFRDGWLAACERFAEVARLRSGPAAPPDEELQQTAREFVAYWLRNGGCGMCGGVPHSTSCFVGRMQAILARSGAGAPQDQEGR